MPKYSKLQIARAFDKIVENLKKESELNKPPHQSVIWVKQTAIEILDILNAKADLFDEENSPNKITDEDMVNVLQLSLNLILKAMGEKQIKS